MKINITISLDEEIVNRLKAEDNYSQLVNEQMRGFYDEIDGESLGILKKKEADLKRKSKEINKERRKIIKKIDKIAEKERKIIEKKQEIKNKKMTSRDEFNIIKLKGGKK